MKNPQEEKIGEQRTTRQQGKMEKMLENAKKTNFRLQSKWWHFSCGQWTAKCASNPSVGSNNNAFKFLYCFSPNYFK